MLDRDREPARWAAVHHAQAASHAENSLGKLRENYERAIADCNSALSVRTREAMPAEWAETTRLRGIIYQKRIEGNRAENIEQAIADFNAALEVFTRIEYAESWGITHINRGHAYHERIYGSPGQNIEQAIVDFNTALEVFEREKAPDKWAAALLGRGQTYIDRIQGHRTQDIEQAIADIEAALQVYTYERDPIDWARAEYNLASAYMDRTNGNLAENIEQAIHRYDAVLAVRTRETEPMAWAKTLVNRGIAYTHRLYGSDAENIEQAIADFDIALEVCTRELAPIDWAVIHDRRGTAYKRLMRGDHGANLEQAIQNYNAALEVLTPEEVPIEWAASRMNRGNAYLHRIVGNHSENLERAISDYNAALDIFKHETLPIEWATTLKNRADAYSVRIVGDHVANLEQALADYDAALTIRRPETFASEYRTAHLGRSRVLTWLGRWQEAHEALLKVREVQRELIAMADSDASRAAIIAEFTPAEVCLVDAQMLLRLGPLHREDAVIALEEGRAQSLRTALDLDSVDPARLSDIGARNRAETFTAARDTWRMRQRQARIPLPESLSTVEKLALREQRMCDLKEAYDRLIEASAAIRQHDNQDFLAQEPTFEQIGHAVTRADEALVYLVGGQETGFALAVTHRGQLRPKVHHIHLPYFTFDVLARLLRTGAPRVWRNFYGDPISRNINSGGFWQAQMGKALYYLRAWGDSVNEALRHLPTDSGLAVAVRTLHREWSAHPSLRSLLSEYFDDLDEIHLIQMEKDLTKVLLNTELEWLLMDLGKTGLNDIASWLQAQRIRRVTFIPYNLLGLFPLPAIQVNIAGREGRLGEMFEVTIAPSAHALEIAKLRANAAERQNRLILTAGNPSPLAGSMGELKFAEAEAESTKRIAELCGVGPVCSLTKKDVTKEKVVSALEKAWLVQLALHGQYQQEAPRQSRLILAGRNRVPEPERTITLEECLDGAINLKGVRLLILSACETSIIDIRQTADEVLGMAAGFLQAGAAGVIASLWVVDDRATFLLMSRFMQLYLDPEHKQWSPARCLAEAQKWLREEATNKVLAIYDPIQKPVISKMRSLRFSAKRALIEIRERAKGGNPEALPYADPFYWAAFTITGC